MRLAYNSILLSATDTRKCRALIMVSVLHFGQNKGNARSSVCLSSCNLVFAPQQGQNTHCRCSTISAASFRWLPVEGLVKQPHMLIQQNPDGIAVHHGRKSGGCITQAPSDPV